MADVRHPKYVTATQHIGDGSTVGKGSDQIGSIAQSLVIEVTEDRLSRVANCLSLIVKGNSDNSKTASPARFIGDVLGKHSDRCCLQSVVGAVQDGVDLSVEPCVKY